MNISNGVRNLNRYIEKNKVKISWIASALNKSEEYISNILETKTVAKKEDIMIISQILDMDVRFIFHNDYFEALEAYESEDNEIEESSDGLGFSVKCLTCGSEIIIKTPSDLLLLNKDAQNMNITIDGDENRSIACEKCYAYLQRKEAYK